MTASRCSRCDHVAPSLGQLRKHAAAAHPNAKPRKKKARPDAPPAPTDRERSLLDSTAALFDSELAAEEMTADAYDRVLSYLVSRYGSAPESDAA